MSSFGMVGPACRPRTKNVLSKCTGNSTVRFWLGEQLGMSVVHLRYSGRPAPPPLGLEHIRLLIALPCWSTAPLSVIERPSGLNCSGSRNSPFGSLRSQTTVTSKAGLCPKFCKENVGGAGSESFQCFRAKKTGSPLRLLGCGQKNWKSKNSFSRMSFGASSDRRASLASLTASRAAFALIHEIHALIAANKTAAAVLTAVNACSQLLSCASITNKTVP